MTHPVVYSGDFNALLKEWDEKAKQVTNGDSSWKGAGNTPGS
jgi:hypothetical protein